MRKITCLLLLCLGILGQLNAQQSRTITGKVTDGNNLAVPSVSVTVKGTSVGTVTNESGSFSLSVPAGSDILVFSSTAFTSQEVAIGDKSVINVSLAATDKNLQEVVVVGYGTQRRRDVTGSMSSIAGAKLRDQPIQSFEQGLSGRAAGVSISIPNGVVNNPPVIRVRGVNSISLSSFPLVVIDGVPVFTGNTGGTASNNVLSDINPSDIESIEVLKDASAAAIYGSRASAGVLLITTKKGRSGKARINYEGSAGFTKAFNLIDLLNAQEFTDLKNEGLVNAGTPPNGIAGPDGTILPPATGSARGFYTMKDANGNLVDTRWYDYLYRTGFSQNHSLNISGANEKTNYYFSTGYNKTEGMLKNNSLERMTGLFNLDQQVNDWLKIGGKFNYATNNNQGLNSGSLPGAAFNTSGGGRLPMVLAPNVSPFRRDGSYNINVSSNSIGQGNNLTPLSFTNLVTVLDLNRFYSRNDRILSNVYAEIRPIKNLAFRTLYGIDNLTTQNEEFRTGLHGDGVQFNGAVLGINARSRRWNWQNTLQYDTRIGEDHSVNVLVGAEQQYSKASVMGADRRNQADPFFDEFQGGFSEIAQVGNSLGENFLQSYFGRATYDYKKKYYLQANGRRDGYSAFAQKWGNFYGGSVGWIVSEESFWKDAAFSASLSSLKLRGSYGQVGNFQGIGDFVYQSTYNSGLYGTQAALSFANAGNADLTWEKSNKLDIGFTLGVLRDRFTMEFTYYKSDIIDLILNEPQAPSRGIPNNIIAANVGSMTNKGFELTLNGNIISNRNFSWSANFNITTLKNEVTATANNNADITVATAGTETVSIIRVGEPVGSFLLVPTDGINPATGQRIFILNDGTRLQYNHAAATPAARWTRADNGQVYPRGANQNLDGRIFGPALPRFSGGLDNTFRYKGFDLNVLVFYSGGNYVYNGTKAGLHDNRNWNNAKDALDRWTKPGDAATWPKVVFGDNISNGSGLPISNNVEKGDFIKLRNITLGYMLPASVVNAAKLSSVRFYLAAFNAFTFTKYSGFDPEIQTNGNSNGAPSVDRNSVPMARTINVGLNIGF